jgi:hypothetical protein
MKPGIYPLTRILPLRRARHVDTANESTEPAAIDSNERSAGIIQAWRSYLPEDCIGTMIKMGWDRTV